MRLISIHSILGYTLTQIPELILFIYDYLRKKLNQRNDPETTTIGLPSHDSRMQTNDEPNAMKMMQSGQLVRLDGITAE